MEEVDQRWRAQGERSRQQAEGRGGLRWWGRFSGLGRATRRVCVEGEIPPSLQRLVEESNHTRGGATAEMDRSDCGWRGGTPEGRQSLAQSLHAEGAGGAIIAGRRVRAAQSLQAEGSGRRNHCRQKGPGGAIIAGGTEGNPGTSGRGVTIGGHGNQGDWRRRTTKRGELSQAVLREGGWP